MLILGIESSCDETGAAIIEGKNSKVKLLSNILASSLLLHAKSGGIIPENAAREQIKLIIPVIKQAIEQCGNLAVGDIDAIAITYGPGLIGSLLVGVETAKTLSYVWNKPLIPTNHLIGHIYANFIEQQVESRGVVRVGGIPTARSSVNRERALAGWKRATGPRASIDFPAIGLIVSGGHTDLVLMKGHGSIKWLGGTRDDAAGEALDKIGRILGLQYPGGPYIEQASQRGDASRFTFPSPLINSKDFDFSFSGLKTAVLREVSAMKQLNNETISDICASFQKAIIDVLVKKTLKAAEQYNAKSILLGGGVAANNSLRENFKFQISNFKLSAKLFVPTKSLCTDNAAMIAAAAYFSAKGRSASGGNKIDVPWQKLDANPNLYF